MQALWRTDRRGRTEVTTFLKERYDTSVRDELRKQFSYGNVMQIPKVEKIVLIKADQNVDYSAVMAAMDQLHQAGVEDIGLVTDQKKEGQD